MRAPERAQMAVSCQTNSSRAHEPAVLRAVLEDSTTDTVLFKNPPSIYEVSLSAARAMAALSLSGLCTGVLFNLNTTASWSASESHPPQRVVSDSYHLSRL
jgi:hypothetical protein